MRKSHYPSYDVMKEKSHWDEHTRTIVSNRLVRERQYQFLTLAEAEILRSWCSILVDDQRGDIIQYVLCHIDQTLDQAKGEGQRKAGTPEAKMIVRLGLNAIDQWVWAAYGKHFFQLEEHVQKQFMMDVSENKGNDADRNLGIPQKEFFNKLLVLTIEAYYSHPKVWSEIGYGGPAYPRGYIRADIGHLDPWEAQPET